MKRTLVVLLLAGVVACKKKDPVPTSPMGIDYSALAAATGATGNIDQQNSGPKRTYVVASARIQPIGSNQYLFTLKFEGSDSLRMVFAKANADYNYHSPKPASKTNFCD